MNRREFMKVGSLFAAGGLLAKVGQLELNDETNTPVVERVEVRSCLGILRLAGRDGPAQLEAACARALAVGARSYRNVDAILEHGPDRCPLPGAGAAPPRPVRHDQLRGPAYYE